MKIEIRFIDDNKKTYAKGIKFEKELINDMQNNNKYIPKMLYMLLLSLSRTMRKKCDFPFYTDLDYQMDGSITSCHFSMNKERHEEQKAEEQKANEAV